MPGPSLAVRLLVEVHAEDERRAELARDLDELDPGRMLAKDIADDQLALRALRRGDDLLGVGDAVGERLLDEHMRARLHRLDGEIGVRVGQRVDRDDVGLQLGERLLEVVERLRLGERWRQLPVGDPALADADDLESGNARIGERVAHPHIAEPDDQHSLGHLSLPRCAASFLMRTTSPVRADSSAASVASSAAAASSGRPIAGASPFSAHEAK